MFRSPFLLCLWGLTAGSVALLWMTEIPLGIPGEWTWDRIRIDAAERAEALLGALLAGLALLGYAAFCWAGTLRSAKAGRAETAAWLAGLAAVGFGWLGIVQASPPAGQRLPKAASVLYYPGSSGYFYEARRIDDVGTFLAGYEDWMARGDVLHIGTHPPGLFLLHRGLIRLCETFPGLTDLLLATQPASVQEAMGLIAQSAGETGVVFGAGDRAALWLAALLTQFAAAATVVPLYLLLRQSRTRSTSWRVVSFWPLVPAVAVFLPKSDALYPFLATLFLWTTLRGWNRASAVAAFAAGLLFWLGLFLSLAFLPVGLLAVLLCAWRRLAPESGKPHTLRAVLRLAVCGLTGLLLPVLLLWIVWDLNLFNVWTWNYRNHAAFYGRDAFPRTYWKWLLVNPVELALAVGVPVVCLVVAAYGRTVRQLDHWRRRDWGPFVCCAAVWGLLWLSGKTMGEAARLWLFLMPWCLWLSAGFWELPPSGPTPPQPSRPLQTWATVLLVQGIVCTATVMRVNGFPLPFPVP